MQAAHNSLPLPLSLLFFSFSLCVACARMLHTAPVLSPSPTPYGSLAYRLTEGPHQRVFAVLVPLFFLFLVRCSLDACVSDAAKAAAAAPPLSRTRVSRSTAMFSVSFLDSHVATACAAPPALSLSAIVCSNFGERAHRKKQCGATSRL